MKFRIPFTISSIDRLRKTSKSFTKFVKPKKRSKLKAYLQNADVKITREEYIAVSIKSFLVFFAVLYLISSTILYLVDVNNPFGNALILALVFSLFVSFSQLVYPKVYSSRKQKNIEKNLISALEDILVQLTSGIPLFTILVNISSAGYEELSGEFKKAVRKINAGFPQIEVLEELGEKNVSLYFRRTLWQISNGMKAGSDIALVIRDSIKALNEEQVLQIQTYGNKLNPLIMFYMLISVILPALAITFLTIISSLVSLPETLTVLMFVALFIFVILIQIVFLGAIKSARPSLL